eukprot:scaffold345671_cov42-Prasinocladus_malaysianus.AAC.1
MMSLTSQKDLELKRAAIQAAADKFDLREARRRQKHIPDYGEYEKRVEASMLPRGLHASHENSDQWGHEKLPPLVTRSAPNILLINSKGTRPAFGRRTGAASVSRIKVRRNQLHLDENPQPLYQTPSYNSCPLRSTCSEAVDVVDTSDLAFEPKAMTEED